MVYAFDSLARKRVMHPPAAGPLIHASTTPMANEVAIAASIASPPFSSTATPTSAARRCCAATTPPGVGMTFLRTTCVLEKLSIGMGLRIRDDLRMRGEPHTCMRADVANQLVENPYA